MTSTVQFILRSVSFKNISNDEEFHKKWRITMFYLYMTIIYFIMLILVIMYRDYMGGEEIKVEYLTVIFVTILFLLANFILMLIISTIIKIRNRNLSFIQIFRITVFSFSLSTMIGSFGYLFLIILIHYIFKVDLSLSSLDFDRIIMIFIPTVLIASFLINGFINLKRNINTKK